mmetsp:Transcript_98058/g.245658  ORF Transcript_98058/g.245658 Transcript_98058/m.245658 type:complete len:448 (+) Transcript_98058:83-1426(+)
MHRPRTVTWPLKLRARERLCSCSSCHSSGLSDADLTAQALIRPHQCEKEFLHSAKDEPEAHVDIVSTSTSASPMSSPRTDSTDSSGLPQHIAVDEAYWSPSSGPTAMTASTAASTACDSPPLLHEGVCRPPGISGASPATAAAAAKDAVDGHVNCSLAAWKDAEEFFLPPGLLSPGPGLGCGEALLGEDGIAVESCLESGLEALDPLAYPLDVMAAMEGMPSLESMGMEGLQMEAFLQWQQQQHDDMVSGVQQQSQQVWSDALSDRMHFDKLTRAVFGNHLDMNDNGETDEAFKTTVMIRNLPNSYSRQLLLDLLDSEGFMGRYDFVYLPIDFTSAVNLGYAFIDLVSPADAHTFIEHFTGFSRWCVGSEKVCVVSWSSPHQGLEQHVERYRSSPVMHPNIPEDWKPLIFMNGVRVPFPPPTKHIKAPKVRCRPEVAQASAPCGGQA